MDTTRTKFRTSPVLTELLGGYYREHLGHDPQHHYANGTTTTCTEQTDLASDIGKLVMGMLCTLSQAAAESHTRIVTVGRSYEWHPEVHEVLATYLHLSDDHENESRHIASRLYMELLRHVGQGLKMPWGTLMVSNADMILVVDADYCRTHAAELHRVPAELPFIS